MNADTQKATPAKKGGTVLINDPIVDKAREYTGKRGASLSWFFGTAGKIFLYHLKNDPDYLDKIPPEALDDTAG